VASDSLPWKNYENKVLDQRVALGSKVVSIDIFSLKDIKHTLFNAIKFTQFSFIPIF
jgi:hypothetical protein